MNKDEVRAKVSQMVKDAAGETYAEGASFKKMDIDSIERIEMIYDVEQRFRIAIDDDTADRIKNEELLINAVLARVDAE